MADKNIQMRHKNGSGWDNLFPKTKASLTVLNDGTTVEQKIAQILNDLNDKITIDDVQTEVQKIIGAAPEALDTLEELARALGNDADFAATITNQLANKVDKVSGKGLSTNDFTDTYKSKLDGIEAGANKYTHPTGDGNLHVPATGTSNNGKFLKAGSSAGSVSWASITISDVSNLQSTLNSKANSSNVYTKSEVDNKIANAMQQSVYVGTDEPTGVNIWFQVV